MYSSNKINQEVVHNSGQPLEGSIVPFYDPLDVRYNAKNWELARQTN